MSIPPARLEAIIAASGIAPRIEALLPAGVRHRQLKAATLILGMMLALADRRPAHLTEVHAALTALPPADQSRLSVTENWKTGPHQLTYRQTERTFGLITAALAYTTGIRASRLLGSRLASFVALLEVVAAVVFAWILLGELPGAMQAAGGLLILAGVVGVKLGEPRTPAIEPLPIIEERDAA